ARLRFTCSGPQSPWTPSSSGLFCKMRCPNLRACHGADVYCVYVFARCGQTWGVTDCPRVLGPDQILLVGAFLRPPPSPPPPPCCFRASFFRHTTTAPPSPPQSPPVVS